MIKIIFGDQKPISFIDNFLELSVNAFCNFIYVEEKHFEIEDKLKAVHSELKNIAFSTPKAQSLIDSLENDLMALELALLSARIDVLSSLTKDPTKTKNILLNTQGVTFDVIRKAMLAIQENMGSFEPWFNSIKPVKNFRFSDFKKRKFYNLFNTTNFEVFDTDSQTVLRDSAANMVASRIETINKELEINRWENLPVFIAYVCRPSSEKEEIDVLDETSFFGGKKIALLSTEDRLKGYNKKLAETVEKRALVFRELPLATALGVYKQYFFLSRR